MLAETLREFPEVPSQVKEHPERAKGVDSTNGDDNMYMGGKNLCRTCTMEDYEITPQMTVVVVICSAAIIAMEIYLFYYR